MATTKIPIGKFPIGTKVIKEGLELPTLNVEQKYLHNIIFRTKTGTKHWLNNIESSVFNLSFSLVNNEENINLEVLQEMLVNYDIDCVGFLYINDDYNSTYTKGLVTKIGLENDEYGQKYLKLYYITETLTESETSSDGDSSDMLYSTEIIDTFTPILVEVE